MLKIIVIALIFPLVTGKLHFPAGFKLGVATASYQVEGGWNSSGKGENIWDHLTHHHPELITDHTTGDIACDSYHKWEEDIKILKDLGVDHYRFSLSWSRILPEGFANRINPDGINYYNNLINALVKNGIIPLVTIYHWDLPQPLQDIGGWTNPVLAEYFQDFSRIVFENFGDRVKYWITINEPSSICVGTYEDDNGSPHVRSPGVGLYLCGKTLLLAHARAYKLYQNYFKKTQRGKIGITIDSLWAEPKTNSSEDTSAAERAMQMQLGWWAHPIFSKGGNYPQVMINRISDNSKKEGFLESRLQPLSKEEITSIRGSFDFFGLNHYHTWLISNHEYPVDDPASYKKDVGTVGVQDPNWKPLPSIVPWGMKKLLNWVKNEYNNPLVIITENGFGDQGGLQDHYRVLFLKEFMKAVIEAVTEDGCNVNGYTVWSVMDNMEWRSGYTVKFGIYNVDFDDRNRTRTSKASASFYKEVIRTRSIPEK